MSSSTRPYCNIWAPPWIECCRRWIVGREEEVVQRLQHPHYSRSHCPPLLHPVPAGFGSHSRGSMMGRWPFLLQLELYLATVHSAPSGRESVSSLISCLSGKAMEWANAVWSEGDVALDQYAAFSRFRAVFDHPPEGRAAGERLFHLRQGTRSAQDFALDFRTLAASAGTTGP